jgi:hypothetical protein
MGKLQHRAIVIFFVLLRAVLRTSFYRTNPAAAQLPGHGGNLAF